jgi:HD-like signal output (HDOD) protein
LIIRSAIDHCEEEFLGFTHCESGEILAELWGFSPDVISAIEFHHKVAGAQSAQALVSLVHVCDRLCRLRDLGYGYYEAMGVELAQTLPGPCS